jgi:hypothetical protein
MKIETQDGDIFKSSINSIPCQILVTSYIDEPAIISGLWENSHPGCFEFEFDVYDRKGYPAKWLEAKLNDEINDQISEEFQALLVDRRND